MTLDPPSRPCGGMYDTLKHKHLITIYARITYFSLVVTAAVVYVTAVFLGSCCLLPLLGGPHEHTQQHITFHDSIGHVLWAVFCMYAPRIYMYILLYYILAGMWSVYGKISHVRLYTSHSYSSSMWTTISSYLALSTRLAHTRTPPFLPPVAFVGRSLRIIYICTYIIYIIYTSLFLRFFFFLPTELCFICSLALLLFFLVSGRARERGACQGWLQAEG